MRAITFASFLLLCIGASAAPAPEAPVRREIGSLVLEGVPDVPPEVAERINQYQNTRAAIFMDWAPDGGGLLMLTRFGETFQAHSVAAPARDRRQLTFFPEPVRNAAYDPANPAGFLVQMDAGGGEAYQIHWFDLATGRARLLTDGRSRNESMLVPRRGGRFAFVSTRRNQRDFDLWVQPLPHGEARLVKELEGQWEPLDWSPDESKILLKRYVSVNESYLHVVDVATGAMTEVNPRPGQPPVAYAAAAFDGAGGVVFASDEGFEFQRLFRGDLATGRVDVLTPDTKWDVEDLVVSPDRRHVAYAVNENGASVLHLAPLPDGGARAAKFRPRRVEIPKGVIATMRFDGQSRRLGFTLDASDSPNDVWSVDVKKPAPVRWTFSEVGGLDPRTFVTPEAVEYASFDGRRIPAWYYRPRSPKPAPVIVSIHGGPEAQAKASFSGPIQFWVNDLGAAVLVPNVRGSAGYGKSYLQLDNGRRREDSVRDIGALLDWIAARPELDKSRVAVYGGSYGGYMVLDSLVRYGDRLRCGVDVVGISHFVTFLEKTEAYRRDLRRAEYGDEREPEMRKYLDSISPLTNASKIARPLFVVQGQNDPRVPVGEAEQIVRAVRGNGGTVWYLLAKDEGHGLMKKRNRDFFLQATALFLQSFLVE